MTAGSPERAQAQCPRCGAYERHRLVALFLDRTDMPRAGQRVLHTAPEESLSRFLEQRRSVPRVTIDLNRSDISVGCDLEHLPFRSSAFELVLSVHVLEHVADDHTALRELARVMMPEATAILLVPADLQQPVTLEDPAVVEPAERLRLYGQEDHVRLYGRDVVDRLALAGLEVEVIEPGDVSRASADVHAVAASEPLYRCRVRDRCP
jgi:SAM-dependent methyltransferase